MIVLQRVKGVKAAKGSFFFEKIVRVHTLVCKNKLPPSLYKLRRDKKLELIYLLLLQKIPPGFFVFTECL